MSSSQHIFTRFGGTRFVATMACGFASALLVKGGHLSGDEFVELGKWTIGLFIGGNASQNIAGAIAGKRAINSNTTGGGNDTN